MQTKWPWFERSFEFTFPATKMPDILERLRGTAVRVEAAVSKLTETVVNRRESENSWSIKENIGHLADLEPLWAGRIQDLVSGEERLRDADLTNRPTFDADHNSKPVDELIGGFRSRRDDLVKTLSQLRPDQWSLAALHPRLETPMRVVDLCQFVADHDDYHLARIRYLAEDVA